MNQVHTISKIPWYLERLKRMPVREILYRFQQTLFQAQTRA